MGLNDSLNTTRSQILLLDPLPSINRVFAIMVQEERQKSIGSLVSTPGNMLTLATRFEPPNPRFNHSNQHKKQSFMPGNQFKKKERPMCSHCGLIGHTIDQCFKLHGYPPGYKPRPRNSKSGNANQATITSDNDINQAPVATNSATPAHLNNILQSLSTTHCQDLVNYFSHQLQPQHSSNDNSEPHTGLTCCVTSSSGNSGIVCSIYKSNISSKSWIVDSGASQHITNDQSLFYSMTKAYNTTVLLPDNTSFPVTLKGSIQLNDLLTIHDVFYVPSFKFNLLSVSALLTNKTFTVTFSPNKFILQDSQQRMIGMGKLISGLYVLEVVSTNPAVCSSVSIQTWHNRLGHPSMSHLQKLHKHFHNID